VPQVPRVLCGANLGRTGIAVLQQPASHGGLFIEPTFRARGSLFAAALSPLNPCEGTLSTCLTAGRVRPLVMVSAWFRQPFYYSPRNLWCMFCPDTNNGGRRRSSAGHWQRTPTFIGTLPEVEVDWAVMNPAKACISTPPTKQRNSSCRRRRAPGETRAQGGERRTAGTAMERATSHVRFA
jgi:hypothetical protein